jgi:hypothetical protein
MRMVMLRILRLVMVPDICLTAREFWMTLRMRAVLEISGSRNSLLIRRQLRSSSSPAVAVP